MVRNVLLTAGLVVFAALTAALSFGDDRQTVVRIGGCSGVCVDPSGLVLTAKHCQHESVETVFFVDRQVSAKRIYVTDEVEGPVVFDCEGEGFPYQPMADRVPEEGSVVSTTGYPAIDGQRVFRRETGTLLRGGNFQFQGEPFVGNVTDMPLIGGWSGGPLLNEAGEVCGLLSASNKETSVFITFTATRKAYDAVKADKPLLSIFTTSNCTGCIRFKTDYGSDLAFRGQLQSAFRVEFIDADQKPDLARQYNIAEVPTFLAPNVRVNGYPGKQALIDRLLTPNGNWQPITESGVDWSHVSIIVLAAQQDVGNIRGTIRGRLLDLAVGPLQRRVAEATEGKAALTIIAERTEPERFALVAQAARVHVDPFFVLVLVKHQDLGLKGLIAGVLEKAIGEHLGSVPIDLIFERVHAEDYARVVNALTGATYQTPDLMPGKGPNDDGKFPVQETALGGILAALTERLQLIRKLTGWWERRKLK